VFVFGFFFSVVYVVHDFPTRPSPLSGLALWLVSLFYGFFSSQRRAQSIFEFMSRLPGFLWIITGRVFFWWLRGQPTPRRNITHFGLWLPKIDFFGSSNLFHSKLGSISFSFFFFLFCDICIVWRARRISTPFYSLFLLIGCFLLASPVWSSQGSILVLFQHASCSCYFRDIDFVKYILTICIAPVIFHNHKLPVSVLHPNSLVTLFRICCLTWFIVFCVKIQQSIPLVWFWSSSYLLGGWVFMYS